MYTIKVCSTSSLTWIELRRSFRQWSVLQYVIIRIGMEIKFPLAILLLRFSIAASIAGIICERFDVLCEADGFSFRAARVYLEGISFISITYVFDFSMLICIFYLIHLLSIALYGLLIFYGLMNEELKDRRPMAKFLSIKLIVMFTFYQSFVVRLSHDNLQLRTWLNFSILVSPSSRQSDTW